MHTLAGYCNGKDDVGNPCDCHLGGADGPEWRKPEGRAERP